MENRVLERLRIAKRSSEYKVWACQPCDTECIAMPIEQDVSTGTPRPKSVIVICPKCLTAFKQAFAEYQKTMAEAKV